MAAIPDHIKKFMADHGVAHDEIWPLPGGRSFAVKHSALERIAHKHAITFDAPQIIEANGKEGVATLLVTAHLGDATTWTFGEASPKNNKNAYCFAMAEKRAKDRCILKLLDTHGAIYSEDEADEFRQPTEQQTRQQTRERALQQQETTAQEYVRLAKEAVEKFGNAANLGAWWDDEKPHRAKAGVVKGTPEYDELFAFVRKIGNDLTGKAAA